jgi:hypothetical protein
MIVLAQAVWADQEPRRSIGDMERRSQLVIQGRVIHIGIFGREEIPVPRATPVVITTYEATLAVMRVDKGTLTGAEAKTKQVVVRCKRTDDARYKGEKGPELTAGREYTLYIEAFGEDEKGGRVGFLHNENNLRMASGDPIKSSGSSESAGSSTASPTVDSNSLLHLQRKVSPAASAPGVGSQLRPTAALKWPIIVLAATVFGAIALWRLLIGVKRARERRGK